MIDSYLTLSDLPFVLCSLAIVGYLLRKKANALPLPPGPRPLPFVGNISGFPTTHEGRFYAKHKSLYGPCAVHFILSPESHVHLRSYQLPLISDCDVHYSERYAYRKRSVGETEREYSR